MTTLSDIASSFLPVELLEVAGAYNALSITDQSWVFNDIIEGSKAFSAYPNASTLPSKVNPVAVHYAVLSGRKCVDLLLAAHNAGTLVTAMQYSQVGDGGPSSIDLCAAATVAVYTQRAGQSADTAAKTQNAALADKASQDADDSAQRVATASGKLSNIWAATKAGEASAYALVAHKSAIALAHGTTVPTGGYYRPGMSDDDQRAISATLDPAIRAKLLADAIALIPPCETPAFKAAIKYDAANATGYTAEQVQTIADGWIGDYDKMQAAYDAINPCAPAPTPSKSSANAVEVGLAFLAAVAIAAAAARAWRRRKKG